MERLFDLLLLDALASRAARDLAREEEEDRPDNFFVLPPDNNRVWQDVFKKCTEENMVVGVEFTTADSSQKPIRAAILRLAQKFNRQAIFLRAPIGPFSTHDQLRRELGGVQYTPSFLIVSFLEDRGEIRRYEGTLEVRAAFETGKLQKDFDECLERRARIRVAENLAERLATGLAAAMARRKQQEEAGAKQTAGQQQRFGEETRRHQWEQEKERRKQEEERRIQEEQREIDEARKAAIEERRKKRPEYVDQLLAMDLNKAPIKEIKDIMRKLEVNPAGLPERKDLIAELKEKVPELRIKLQYPSSTPVGVANQQVPVPSENISDMDHDVLQSVAHRIRNIDLQSAELHELKSLLSQAQLRVRDYPDRNSMVQALNHVLDAADRTRNRSSYFGTVYQSNNLSAGDSDINKFERKAESPRENVEEVAELRRQLAERDQKIESLQGRVRTMEIKNIIDHRGKEVPP